MSVIRTLPRAFFLALFPLALLHAALMANGVAPSASKGTLPVPDQVLLVFMLRLGLDGTLLWLGHAWLRSLRLHGRSAYGVTGGFAAAIGYMVAYRTGTALAEPVPGTILTAAILPVLAGMLSGFLYAQLAGREVVEPQIAEPVSSDAAHAFPADSGTPPVFALYSGPVQVRTSIGASAMAAAIPAFVVSMLTIGAVMPFIAGQVAQEPQPGPHLAYAALLAFPAQVMFATLFMMFVPSLIVVGATHGIARGLGRTRALDYAGIGAGVGLLASMILAAAVPIALLAVLGALVGALMGLIYRRFAGIAPLALPEDVLAEDLSALVPEDHPSRKSHVVIYNG